MTPFAIVCVEMAPDARVPGCPWFWLIQGDHAQWCGRNKSKRGAMTAAKRELVRLETTRRRFGQ